MITFVPKCENHFAEIKKKKTKNKLAKTIIYSFLLLQSLIIHTVCNTNICKNKDEPTENGTTKCNNNVVQQNISKKCF